MAENKVSLEDMKRIIGMREEQEEIARARLEDDGSIKVYNSTLEKLGERVTDIATENLKPALTKVIAQTADKHYSEVEKKVAEQINSQRDELLALADSVRVIEVKHGKKVNRITGTQHNQFKNLLTIVGANQPVLMVGPAGTGKTHAAKLVADTLGLSFHSISVGSQTSKSDLVGYMDANHNYVRTQFREAYECGGVFLLDEADAGNSNVLILLNAALSNGYMAFPDKMVHVHDDFRMIATANTFGHGASRQYVGRNQLDAATLDRFVVLPWDIDDKVETQMAGGNLRWLKVVRAVRRKVVDELELRIVISPRATLRGATLLAAGMDFEDVLVTSLTGSIPESERRGVENLARATWNDAE